MAVSPTNQRRSFLRPWLVGNASFRSILAGAMLGGFCAWCLLTPRLYPYLAEPLERWSYDLLFWMRPEVTASEVVLLYIDDATYMELGQPLNRPLDRRFHIRLLERLQRDGARAVVFDLVFSDPDADPAVDEALIAAITNFGPVVLASDLVATSDRPATEDAEGAAAKSVVPPTDVLLGILETRGDIGLAELDTDLDLVVRRHLAGDQDVPSLRPDAAVMPTLSWAAARMLGAAVTQKDPEGRSRRRVWYYGRPGRIPWESYHRAIPRATDPAAEGGLLPIGYFRDKVVIVGARMKTVLASERKDEYPSPYPKSGAQTAGEFYHPGAEIQATLLLNLLRNEWLEEMPVRPSRAVVVGIALLAGAGLSWMRPVYAILASAGATAALTGIGYTLFQRSHLYVPWLQWVLPIPLCLFWSLTSNWLRIFVEKRLIEQSLAMYLSPKRARQIARRPEMLKPGAEKQELTLLFSDIANFTSLSEGMDSDELALVMNQYFERAVGECIHRTDGTVVKFIGDAIFAMWNAPERQRDHAILACRAALRLRDEVSSFPLASRTVEFRTRIGLHTGAANVGNFGSTKRVDYTAIGENVNLASRMEGLNKYLGTTVLITGDVKAAARDSFRARFCGRFVLKGFDRAVEVHELLAEGAADGGGAAWESVFDGARQCVLEQRWDAAEAAFRQVLALKPGDGPSQFYLHQIEAWRSDPPASDWKGEIHLKEK